MPRLGIFLLGPPRVERDGVAVNFDTRKATALLAALALNDGPQRRDSLAALLWPDYAQGRAALRRTLSALNAALGDGWVASDREQIALQRGRELWIDVDVFRGQLAAARDPQAERAALRAAAQVYRDDLLTGFSLRDSPAFDDWQLAQAEHLRRALAGALERLAQLELAGGDIAAAVGAAQRWLALDPLHEQAHRALMTLFMQAGQRGAAIQQYRDCVRMLERELGVPPLEETTALYRAITAGQPLAAAPKAPAPRAPAPVGAPATPALVGRDAEWAALTRAYAALGPDGTLIVIEGPAGIGKTRLAEELLAHARRHGSRTLQARCHEGEAGLAYAVIVALLRGALALPGAPARLAAIPAWLRGAAARLLPELADGPAPLPPDSADAQLRLFEGVAEILLAATAGDAPALALLDDLQWADYSSLDCLAYLVRRLRGRALGIVAAWRGDDLPAAHPLRALLAELRRAGAATQLALGPLSSAAVAALLGATPGAAALPSGTAEQLFAETEGLPLLVVEYLAMLRAADPPAAGQPWALPSVARDLLQARLGRAGAMGAQLLAAAAVIGRSFDSETLRAVSGRSEDEVASGLEELTGLGIVVEGQAYDFSHGKLRDLVYAETGLARRRLLHRRVAEALGARAHGPDAGAAAGLIAQHYQLAGQDRLAAAAFAQAGHHAREIAASATALAHYSAALALGHPEPGPLHSAIGDLQTLAGRYDAALVSYETAASLADPDAVAGVETKIAEVHRRRGDWALAERHLRAGLDALGADGDAGLRARLTADRSLTAHQAGETPLALELAHAALALAERGADQRALAQTHNLLGLLARETGDPAAASAHLERSLALAERGGDTTARAAALHNLALAQGDRGELEVALALAEQALALCEAQGDRHRAAAIHNTIADLLHAAGRDAAAIERLKRAVALFAAVGADAGQAHPAIWQLTTW